LHIYSEIKTNSILILYIRSVSTYVNRLKNFQDIIP
jgi:hypothetical protein